jgi:peroxiredoxin
MKNVIILFGICCLFAMACKTKNATTTIMGTIEGLPNTEINIKSLDSSLHIDTIISVSDGKFSFTTDKIAEPTPINLQVRETGESALIFTEPGNLSFTATTGSLQKLVLKGSKSHNEFMKYHSAIEPILARGDILTAKSNNAKGQAEMDEIIAEANEIDSLQENCLKDFIKNHSESPVSSFLIFFHLDRRILDFNTTNSYYSLLKGKSLATFFGKHLTADVTKLKSLNIGAIAPTFSLNDVNGKKINSADLKGKYVLLDFWASWCKPCREENPNVVKAYANFKDKGFEILGVSLDEKEANWKEAISADKLTWPQVSDLKGWRSEAAKLYNISSIPTNYLLDKEGKIIAIALRGEQLEAKLKELMP